MSRKEKAEKERKLSYISCQDSSGNVLTEDEILFTDEESFQGKQTLEIWGEDTKKAEYYTVNSPGVSYVFDESENFPVAVVSPEGKRMYLKVSAKTGEILPVHAGCCPARSIIYAGPVGSAKTLNVLQMSDPLFHDAIARGTNCSIEDDLPVQSGARRRYENARKNLRKHILPEATKRGEYIMPYVYYVTYTERSGDRRNMLFYLMDIDGEQCIDMPWHSKILPYDYCFLTIGADELTAVDQDDSAQYVKVVDQLLSRLRVFSRTSDYEIVVIITKADLLDKNDPYLKTAFDNSVSIQNGRIYQTIHGNGFDYVTFNHRQECIRAYLKNQCPALINKLTNVIPEKHLSFCMVANIGENSDTDNHFERFEPFCIDEPLLKVMTELGMYPISAYDENQERKEQVKGGAGEMVVEFLRQMKRIMMIDYDDDDYEEYEEE